MNPKSYPLSPTSYTLNPTPYTLYLVPYVYTQKTPIPIKKTSTSPIIKLYPLACPYSQLQVPVFVINPTWQTKLSLLHRASFHHELAILRRRPPYRYRARYQGRHLRRGRGTVGLLCGLRRACPSLASWGVCLHTFILFVSLAPSCSSDLACPLSSSLPPFLSPSLSPSLLPILPLYYLLLGRPCARTHNACDYQCVPRQRFRKTRASFLVPTHHPSLLSY